MGNLKVTGCEIEGLYVIEPEVREDERGYFTETYNFRDMKEKGLDMVFVQDNQSKSKRGVLRGLHFQIEHPQGKLVRVIKGRVFDVAVDLRSSSATYGKWHGMELSEENKKQFYVPEGFAHGFWFCRMRQNFVINVLIFITQVMREELRGMTRKLVCNGRLRMEWKLFYPIGIGSGKGLERYRKIPRRSYIINCSPRGIFLQ